MTKWLKAAQQESRIGEKLNLPKQPPAPVLSSVYSGGRKADAAPLDMRPDELARDIYDLYEERAAIREYDGGQNRVEAERAAWVEARRALGITELDDWRKATCSRVGPLDANDECGEP